MHFSQMIQFNDTDEYNSIRTGITVYISGLFGQNSLFLNNQSARVKDILVSVKDTHYTYVAQVTLTKNNSNCFINFDYIFKVGKELNNADIKSLIWYDNPFDYYIDKKKLVKTNFIRDEHGQLIGLGTDRKNRTHAFLYSGIN